MAPQIQSVLPKYLQVANHLRNKILSGELPPGSEVPSERQIATEWQISRPTAAKALEALRVQGLVNSRQGSGTYVRDVLANRRASHRYEHARQHGSIYGPGEHAVILKAGLVAAPDHVAETYGLEPGSLALARRRLIVREDAGPVEIATSWWPPDLADVAPRLLRSEPLGGGGSVPYIESVTGVRASYARDRAAARLASGDEAELLKLGSPAAVLEYRHVVFARDEQGPMEYVVAVYPPGRWSLEQEYMVE